MLVLQQSVFLYLGTSTFLRTTIAGKEVYKSDRVSLLRSSSSRTEREIWEEAEVEVPSLMNKHKMSQCTFETCISEPNFPSWRSVCGMIKLVRPCQLNSDCGDEKVLCWFGMVVDFFVGLFARAGDLVGSVLSNFSMLAKPMTPFILWTER